MDFALPSLVDLQKIIDLVEADYNASRGFFQKENPERPAFFTRYRAVMQKTRSIKDKKLVRQILFGMLVQELEMIKQIEYKGLSPQKETSLYAWVTGSGSEVYSSIKKHLGIIDPIRLDDDLRLVCLNKYHQYAKEQFYYKSDLISQIHGRLKGVAERIDKRVAMIAEGMDFLNKLQDEIKLIRKKYHADVLGVASENLGDDEEDLAKEIFNPKREAQIGFIEAINKSCIAKYSDEQGNARKDFAYLLSCNVQCGAILFALLMIKKEYDGYWPVLSPERSRLYRRLKAALGIKSLSKLDPEKKIEWLRALQEHFKVTDTKELHKLVGFENLNKLLKEFIDQQEVKKHESSWAETIMSTLVRYSVGFFATKVAAEFLLPIISASTAGPVGLIIYLGGGTILMSQFGRLVTEGYITRGASYLFAWKVDKISRRMTKSTMEAVNVTPEGFQDLRVHEALTQEDQELEDDVIDAWLTMDDDIVSPQRKAEIRQMLPKEMTKEYKQTASNDPIEISSFVLC